MIHIMLIPTMARSTSMAPPARIDIALTLSNLKTNFWARYIDFSLQGLGDFSATYWVSLIVIKDRCKHYTAAIAVFSKVCNMTTVVFHCIFHWVICLDMHYWLDHCFVLLCWKHKAVEVVNCACVGDYAPSQYRYVIALTSPLKTVPPQKGITYFAWINLFFLLQLGGCCQVGTNSISDPI